MAKPVKLSTRTFETQTLALKYYREMLGGYEDGDRITDPEHDADLRALIERYDPLLENHGQPVKGYQHIAYFERRRTETHGTSCFYFVRNDGTEDKFSYRHAVIGKLKDSGEEFADACRQAVHLDCIVEKKRLFALHANNTSRMRCEKTGQLVTYDEAHLDHEGPFFAEIVSEFQIMNDWQKGIPDDVISEPQALKTTATFNDCSIENAFRKFYRQHAKFRILSVAANLSTAHLARRLKG